MFKILVDTCVWLDLAKDYQRQAVLEVLEELIRQKQVSIFLPRTVFDEFTRNKTRLPKKAAAASGVLKRVKEAVDRLGDAKKKRMVLEQLNELDYKIPTLGEAAIEAIGRIEKLFSSCTVVETASSGNTARLLNLNHVCTEEKEHS